MGAAGLIEIKRRIKSIENTKKITKAMQLVSTSKLRKVKENLEHSNKYKDLTEEIVLELSASLPENFNSIYINNNATENKKLYVVLTSETGLCGGFNSNVVNYLRNTINNTENSYIVVIGERGVNYLNKFKIPSNKVFNSFSEVPTSKDVSDIYNYIFDLYEKGEISEINLIYTEFKSHLKQNVVIKKLLPLSTSKFNDSLYNIEPNIYTTFNTAVNIYIKSTIMNSLINSRCSEESSRRVAMEGATNNADEILRHLNKKFNRIRQSMITQEISEIVSGAEAQR